MQILKMLEPYDLKQMGFHTTESIHLIVEAEKRAFADRSKYLGDPDFISIPVEELLDSTYLNQRMKDYTSTSATVSDSISPGEFNFIESDQTTHYSIVDFYGNAVSVTTTLNSSYGSGVVVGGAGFLLNNEMDDFSSKPGTANTWGLIGDKANAIEPNKRPLSSMTPTILMYDGYPIMTIGSPGGSKIITTVLQCILNVVIHNMDIKEAICSPRIHHQWLPEDIIYIEPNGMQKDIIKDLESLGHIIEIYGVGYMGVANGIIISDEGYYGAGDCRNETSAIGY